MNNLNLNIEILDNVETPDWTDVAVGFAVGVAVGVIIVAT